MSTGNPTPKPKKGSRVAGVQLQPSRFVLARDMLKRADVLSRIGLCCLAAVLMWAVTFGWERPFSYSVGDVPERAIAARVPFSKIDTVETQRKKEIASLRANAVYKHDRGRVDQLFLQFEDKVRALAQVTDEELTEETLKKSWADFMLDLGSQPEESSVETSPQFYEYFTEFRQAFKEESDITEFLTKVDVCLGPIKEKGILFGLKHDIDVEGGNQKQITIVSGDGVDFDDVPVALVRDEPLPKLKEELEKAMSETLARHAFSWFKGKLDETLTYDKELSRASAKEAAEKEKEVPIRFEPGDKLVDGANPIDTDDLALLRLEDREARRLEQLSGKLARSVAHFGMFATIFSLCGFYSLFRRSNVLLSTNSLLRVLCTSVLAVGLCKIASVNSSETVIIPLLLYSMTLVVAFEQELALLLSICMALVAVVTLGLGLYEFTTFVASMATAVLCLRHIRNRTKLIYVGLVVATIATATAIGAATLTSATLDSSIFVRALWYGFFAIVAGMLMSASLPAVEKLFDVQTELSLLEWADISQPLLQELVRRAPGTYNHTINVASIAEAAADAIGANGLLVRVGAYFHDIGKMLKPGYFIENQSDGANRHESLLPAMSTLVIIAHVKDGADLARQHGLPNVLVDFIMQHHGTTLVEYFYNRANEQSESDPDSGEVDEHSYRYPGPKPQTKETAVLMLADTVESATRSLTDPTPSRIENLVHDLAMKKLLDGQFDECGLTLSELKRIEVSLIKSVSAVYHSRIKYPDQQSA